MAFRYVTFIEKQTAALFFSKAIKEHFITEISYLAAITFGKYCSSMSIL